MNKPNFSEEDIKKLFGPPTPAQKEPQIEVEFQSEAPKPIESYSKKQYENFLNHQKPIVIEKMSFKDYARTFGMFFGMFLLLFVISYSVINSQSLIEKTKYFWEVEYKNDSWADKLTPPQVIDVRTNKIYIPKLNVQAPILWNVSEENIIDQLQFGVAHYKGTALPGQVGNVFITGHSSYYIWAAGQYKSVFALLDKLNSGDEIYIAYKGAMFKYKVTSKKVVSPQDLSVLGQGNINTLTLMTCTPLGTAINRLIVTAEQVAQ